MGVTTDDIGGNVGRFAAELTRGDVARALLAVPATIALDALPSLRRELLAAGNPLSSTFWTTSEQVLTDVAAGRATVGGVRRWVHATGTEPIDLLLAQGFVWPDEDERGPVAVDMHARLVAHLERLVAEGTVDPDRLVEEDPEAWAAYERLQVEWLHRPQPDGSQPIWAISDEQDDEFLADWDAADADAREIMAELLADTPPRSPPEAALREACHRLRAGLDTGQWPYDLLRAAGGVDPAQLPPDDAELWLTLATGAVTCRDEPPDGLDDDAHAAWMTLTHPDWIAPVVTLVRSGPGTAADAESLAQYAVSFDFEEVDDVDDDIGEFGEFDDGAVDVGIVGEEEGAAAALSAGFGVVVLLWSMLGAVDAEERLTPLGCWGLPESLRRAWSPPEQ